MMKVLLAVLSVLALSTEAICGLTLSIYGGERFYLGNNHEPFNEPFTKGARFDFGKTGWPANIALDFYITNHSDLHYINGALTDLDTTLTEIRIGLRKYYGQGLRFLIGGGIENMEYKRKDHRSIADGGSSSCSASTGYTLFKNGVWAEAGVDYALGKVVVLGLKADYSNGYLSCYNRTINLNAINGGVYLGITW
jgi:hypothetical protein